MKFVELKKSLDQKLNNLYIISGEDRFLCYNALEIIKKKINLTFPDLNCVVFSEQTYSEQTLIEAGLVLPFGDEFRLIIVKDVPMLKTVGDALNKYFNSPSQSTVIVFLLPERTEYSKKLETFGTFVDCSILDEITLQNWIVNFLAKKNVKISRDAMSLLIEFTGGKLTRISTELEKLVCFVGENATIDASIVEKFVTKDKEYQIYEFTEAIANGKIDLSVEMLYTLQGAQKSEYSLITPLYNYFRRLLFIKISTLSDAELAKKFGIKEFAVKKMREKTRFFSARNLKKCVDLIAESDLNIKSGKMASDVAVKFTVLQIINLRKQ